MPWQTVCKAVPMSKVRSFVDQWLLSSGAPATTASCERSALDVAHGLQSHAHEALNVQKKSVILPRAGNARFDTAVGQQSAYTLQLALQLMRMISCCSGRSDFLQRSGMLLRCVHVLRHITAACPVSGGSVCIMHSQCCPLFACAVLSSLSCNNRKESVSALLQPSGVRLLCCPGAGAHGHWR